MSVTSTEDDGPWTDTSWHDEWNENGIFDETYVAENEEMNGM